MKKATNSAIMRMKNEKIILSHINKAPVSRVDLAKKTGLTKAAISIIVDDLIQRNIVLEKYGQSSSVGRNPVMLHLNTKAYYIVGINITRLDISVGITDLSGQIICENIFPVCAPDEAFPLIFKNISELIEKSGIKREKIYKASVATPGPVNREKGIILNPPNFKDWHNVEVVSEIEKATGFDAVLENVSSATALAEKYFGSAKQTGNFMTLQVDEGIGSGIVLNDSLFKGPCEFGHTTVKFDGILCECGNRGCLEKYASVPAILKNTPYKSWKEAVDSGSDSVVEKEAEYLSSVIISANNIFDFDKIILCGDISYKAEKIILLLENMVENNILYNKQVEICAGKVNSKILVAAATGVHNLFV